MLLARGSGMTHRASVPNSAHLRRLVLFVAPLALLTMGASATTLCTFEGYDSLGNHISKGSLCDGSYDEDRQRSLCAAEEGPTRSGPPPPNTGAPVCNGAPDPLCHRKLDNFVHISGTMPTQFGWLTTICGGLYAAG